MVRVAFAAIRRTFFTTGAVPVGSVSTNSKEDIMIEDLLQKLLSVTDPVTAVVLVVGLILAWNLRSVQLTSAGGLNLKAIFGLSNDEKTDS